MVQWLRLHASSAGGVHSIPGQGTEIPHAAQRSQKKKKRKKLYRSYVSFLVKKKKIKAL